MSIAKSFMELFRGNDRAHGTFDVTTGERERDGKKQGVARVVKEATTVEMWEDHLDGRAGLGIIPICDDNHCHFGSIDVDQYDIDHKAIIRKLSKLNIPAVVGRSKSGGAHLYFFFSDRISAEDVQSKLSEIAAFLGYGGSEIFPKQTKLLVERGDTGNFLNMPYFAGDLTTRYAYDDKGNSLPLSDFVEYAERHRLSKEKFLDIKTKRENKTSPIPDGPPCLQHLAAQGFGEGSRNNALFNLGVYARLSDRDNWEGLVAKYNQDFMQPPLGHNEVGMIIKQLARKEYFYKCDDQPICGHCNKDVCLTRKFGVGPGRANNDLSGLVKIDGDPAIWIMNVDGQRVELSTEAIASQIRFQKECIEQINMFPIMVNPKAWQVRMQELLANVTVVEVPPEATYEGEFQELLNSFCCDRAKGYEKDDIQGGIAVWLDGRVYFQVKDLRKHLEVSGFEHFTPTKMVQILEEKFKAKRTFWRVRGKGLHVWSLPEEFFEAPEEDERPFVLEKPKEVM
jgi:hypothetical protein